MSFPTEELVPEPRLVQLSPVMLESSLRGMLEVHQDRLIVQTPAPVVNLELTGDVFEQYMRKQMQSLLRREPAFPRMGVFSSRLYRPVVSARSFLSIAESEGWSITTNIEIVQDLNSYDSQGLLFTDSHRM